jgi:hypothetical protein
LVQSNGGKSIEKKVPKKEIFPALLHGSGLKTHSPSPFSLHIDAVGPPETGHLVEDLAGESPIRTRLAPLL